MLVVCLEPLQGHLGRGGAEVRVGHVLEGAQLLRLGCGARAPMKGVVFTDTGRAMWNFPDI